MLFSYVLSTLVAGAVASPFTSVQRRQSAVPFGTAILSCTVPGEVALTFDDGPADYTIEVLDKLAAAGLKATFFLNGQNWGSIDDHVGAVQRMISDGHQVGSHT